MLTFSLLLAAVLLLGLAVFVITRGNREPLSWAFFFFVTAGATWAVAIAVVIHPHTPVAWLLPVGHVAFMAGIAAIAGFLAFTLIYPSPRIPPERRRWLWTVYGFGVLFIGLAATPGVYKGPDPATLGDAQVRPLTGPLFPLYIGFALTCTVLAIVELVAKYRRTHIARERVQLSYLIAGSVVSFGSAVLLTLVLPTFGITRFSTLAPLCSVIGIAGPAVAITKHRLFHLGIVFRHAVVGACVTLALTGVIVGILAVVRVLLGNDPVSLTIGFVTTAFVTAFVLPSVRRYSELAVDRVLFGTWPANTALLRQLSREFTSTLSVRTLSDLLVRGLAHAVRLRSATLYLPDTERHMWNAQSTWPEDYPAWPDLVWDTPVARMARDRLEPFTMDEMRYERGRAAQECVIAMRELDADVVVPLAKENAVIGLLVLSEKLNGEIFTENDVTLLTTLTQQASTALANAMLHEEIVRMKVHNDNVLRDMSSGVIAVDREGQLTTFNRRAAEMLEQSPATALGREADILPPAIANALRDARLHGNTVQQVTCHLARGGTECSLVLNTTVLRNEAGETIGALAVFEDQTERLRLEEGLQRADRLASLGTLAAGLAHEIKNPLVSIRTLAQLLPERFDDAEFRESFAHLAAGEVERINDLLERLLAFARPSLPSLEYVQLLPIIDDVLQLLSAETESHGVVVEREYGEDGLWVLADAAQLRQVFLNLFMNALQAMEEANAYPRLLQIRMSLESQGPATLREPTPWAYLTGSDVPVAGEPVHLTLSVADTGAGIPEELREEIFNPFFTTKAKGSGLGLSVVARIIRDHGGTISAHNNPRGGATFVLEFPARRAHTSPAGLT